MNRIATCLLVCAALAACGDNHKEPLTITLFAAAPDAIEAGDSTKLLFVVTPATAHVEISGVGDVSGQTEAAVSPITTTMFELTATRGTETVTQSVTVTVGPRHAAGLKLEAANPTPTAGDATAVTVTALASDGSVAPGYRGTVHIGSSDLQAVLPADVEFTAADAGVKQVMVTLKTAGLATVTGVDTMNAGTAGGTTVTVGAAPASAYALSTLPGTALAGESLVLAITARDAFGNLATSYTGQAHVASTDATDILPADGAFTNGVRAVSVAFTKVGSHTATVSEVGGTITPVDTNSVLISAAQPFTVALSTPHTTATAGAAETVTARLVDVYGNTATNYTGTVHFTSTDVQATLPADYTFVAGDAGSHDFGVTLATAGPESVTVSESVLAASGSVAWDVLANVATTCATVQTPASTTAGAPIGITVVVHDAFGNVAKGYTGTIGLTATDVRAILPPNATYSPLDAGSHVFSASLLTTGAQVITAADVADPTLHCDALIAVGPGAPGFVLTVPGNANAGYAQPVGIAVRDAFGNPVTAYAGTVMFASTDGGAGAVTPAPIVFNGTQGGVATTSATFVTLGAQTLSAGDGGGATGAASCAVHGLVYTPPATGRVRLVANAASNTQIVQLDLVANERLQVSSFFGGGPGSFAVGMNLPLDTTRVGADAALFTPGTALPSSGAAGAAAGTLGADHVLYTAVARKRVAGTPVFKQETEVQAGQTFYSVRLKLTPSGSVGPVFDGAQPSPLYRAAVRDQWGDDFVNMGDFGVGKLEIR